jgi:hypothetical protein
MGKKRSFDLGKKIRSFFSPKKPIDDVSGIYFGNDNFMRAVSQPSGKPEYVSETSGVVTNFQLASHYGNIGLIAHNYLAGRNFFDLKIGDVVFVMDGLRQTRPYRVISIRQFQALSPQSPRSNFIDLDTSRMLSASEVFQCIYTGDHHLVLQTCIEKGNVKEWGRLFIIAEPEHWD